MIALLLDKEAKTPMNPQALFASIQTDRRMQIIIAVVVVAFVGIMAFMLLRGPGGNSDNTEAAKPLNENQKTLAQVTSLGQALEIQALLAKHGIRLQQVGGDGGKTDLIFMENATQKDRDMAIITLVQSGLMDKNVGLESFDKGDLTASREEKRIKLIRAQQGELARLIRKIEPIEDASVNIAIPEPTLFRSEEKPLSASVQVTLPVGARLNKEKVRAITNLMVGSLQGLDAAHVSLSDTNGNTYNSVLEPGAEIDDKLEDQDNYMKQKVSTQLDRLVGTGNYVVTVSTELRQAPKELMVQEFDPQGAVVNSKQAFNENLNTNGGPGAGGPASSFLPNSLATTVTGGGPNKDYVRNGVEVNYNNSKTQWVETRPVGMIEDISIAVTIDASHFPTEMSVNELQRLLASAASPKVRPENVSIARSVVQKNLPISHTDGTGELPQDMSWLYWAGGAVVFCIIMILLLGMQKGGSKVLDESFFQTQQEIQQLREFASQQQAQIQATQQTQMLLEAQQRQMEQSKALENTVLEAQRRLPQTGGIQQTLEELRETVASDEIEEDNLDLQIKSWIESS
jgi:flagellar M-ring protein FliF